MRYLLIVLVCGAVVGCTVRVDLPNVPVTTGGEVQLTTGFSSVPVDLSDNAQFMEYQSRFVGLDSASLSVQATNTGPTAQTLRVYASTTPNLTRDTVAAGATLLTSLTVPAGTTNQQFTQTISAAGLAFLNTALQGSPPAFTVYMRTDDPDPQGLTFSQVVVIPGQGEFSILSVRAVDGAMVIEFIP
jgi:hypothetical protein